ncbi:hypothetical protein [Micromonospora echinaurantiaca]|uniref:hypothetical protein n=1 Tax=Micromonospora echinaurantiaca TaxID=47857 RepID=UPI0034407336
MAVSAAGRAPEHVDRRGPRRRMYQLTADGAVAARRPCAQVAAGAANQRPTRLREA